MQRIAAAISANKTMLGGLTAVTLLYVSIQSLYHFTPEMISRLVSQAGPWGALLFIGMLAIRPLIFFPSIVMTLAGGMLFGPLWGTLYVVIGATLGACLCFGITRIFGCERFEQTRWGRHLAKTMTDYDFDYGFGSLLTMRLVPLFHWDIVSYASGLSRISFRDYAAATVIGVIPGAAAYNLVGFALTDIFSPLFFTAIVLLTLVLAVPLFWHHRRGRRSRR